MDYINFSNSVRERARVIQEGKSWFPNRYSRRLFAIRQSGWFAGAAKDVSQVTKTQLLKTEQDYQVLLKDSGIVDDQTAMEFLNEAEPKINEWSEQLLEMDARHAQEKVEFLEAIQKHES